ncbi:MAG TPA: chemotaxis protein CheW [Dissulfurispiraceae bacterium]|nr:chemotaxis protein CheW [Dissulfurispiraceae bacterium]
MATEITKLSSVNRGALVSTERTARAGGKFLTFFLAGEEYGIAILKVHEIIGMMPITSVPRTPVHVRGVINLRGKVIPIIDLRLKFGMPGQTQTSETCIIVVTVHGIEIGIVVDRVSEVLNISGADIEDAPSFGAEVITDYILGIGKSQGKVKILLDIDRVLSDQELNTLASSAAESEPIPLTDTHKGDQNEVVL